MAVTGCGAGSGKGGPPVAAFTISPISAGTLPTLHISDNASDRIMITAPVLCISRDLTLRNFGVPYCFYSDRVRVTDSTGDLTPTLSIQAGAELQFDDYLEIGDHVHGKARPGRLLALGTATQPVLFTSSKAAKSTGDWPGIWLRSAAGSRIENAASNGIVSANCRPEGSNDHAGLIGGCDKNGGKDCLVR